MSTLYLTYWIEDDSFFYSVWSETFDQTFTVENEAANIIEQFDTIYEIINERQTSRVRKLQNALTSLSEWLIDPITEQLDDCDLIRIEVPEELIRCAFDLLLYNGEHLFLKRNLCYLIAEGAVDDAPEIETDTALLIADLTADPEEACSQIQELFTEVDYFEIEDASVALVEEYADQVNIIVISAHGEVDDDNEGSIIINDEELSAEQIAELQQWLLYLDSCQQGINLSFLRAFQEESEIEYYVAPIISNDAGDSSTKTILWFFQALKRHGNPMRALFTTRQKLFAYYRDEEELDLVTILNKAAMFRVYERTVEEEEEEDEE